jgi:hypothetical protein
VNELVIKRKKKKPQNSKTFFKKWGSWEPLGAELPWLTLLLQEGLDRDLEGTKAFGKQVY